MIVCAPLGLGLNMNKRNMLSNQKDKAPLNVGIQTRIVGAVG